MAVTVKDEKIKGLISRAKPKVKAKKKPKPRKKVAKKVAPVSKPEIKVKPTVQKTRPPKSVLKNPVVVFSNKPQRKLKGAKVKATFVGNRLSGSVARYTKAEAGVRKRDRERLRQQQEQEAARDIAPIPFETIDWKLRLACKFDLKLFCENYMSSAFYMGWSEDQLICIRKAMNSCLEGGMFALAMPRGGGKALDLKTPIPTVNGWRTMGQLCVGDQVFDEYGKPCNVTFVTKTMYNRKCYKVRFDTGEVIIADADHQWQVRDIWSRKPYLILTTEEMKDRVLLPTSRGRNERRYSIPIPDPVEYPDAVLPIDPYTLGLWLGNGQAAGGYVYICNTDLKDAVANCNDEIVWKEDGSQGCKKGLIKGLRKKLRINNLLGNKHIPSIYMTSSVKQREELLKGIMDTDGSTQERGKCELTFSNLNLLRQTRELLRSLGFKVGRISYKKVPLNGKVFDAYRICFQAYSSKSPFKLKRKHDLLPDPPSTYPISASRRITSIKRIASIPVRCIQVDSPNSLYLAGKGMIPTHNSSICRGTILWATLYGHRKFPVFVGASGKMAKQTLNVVKQYLYQSRYFIRDFPEICYPIRKLENRAHLVKGQTYKGEFTNSEWGSNTVCYPSLLLDKDDVKTYLKHDPDSVRYLKEYDRWLPVQAGTHIDTTGVGGTIRGDAPVHPVTLELPRPDLLLLDDLQNDQKANSPNSVAKLVQLIDGAIQGLAPPGQTIAALMPCTVIREDDAADNYLDREKNPQWKGERCAMVNSWPPGVTDWEITMDTPASCKWNEYFELLRKSYRIYEDGRLATEFYRENRKVMDENFVVSWNERYDKKVEISPQQHAMNLRFKSPDTFPSEFQNQGKRLYTGNAEMISAKQLAKKVTSCPRLCVPADVEYVTAMLDVQNEIFFYTILGTTPNFDGTICDYGTWPPVSTPYFTKQQTGGWSLLTRHFFQVYPDQRAKATRTDDGKFRAPLEAKIYEGLTAATNFLMGKTIVRQDSANTPMKIQRLAIDTRWGQASDVIKRFIRESGIRELMGHAGQSMPPTHNQFEEYTLTKGWTFEHQIHPHVKEPKWVIKFHVNGMRYTLTDVDRQKDFVFARLGSPLGHPGSFSLFNAPAEQHELFCNHICNSEYPEPSLGRGRIKNLWVEREGSSYDNDFLDCLVGCITMASQLGASIKTTASPQRPRRRSLRERYLEKRGV